jgi:hypothetical protein
MRKARARSLEGTIQQECHMRGIPYRKIFYRRLKRKYNLCPRNERHNFDVKTMK